MKFKEHLANLNAYAKEHPESLDFNVVASKDDEGNGYNEIYYTPRLGNFEDGEFIDTEEIEECGLSKDDINAICIN